MRFEQSIDSYFFCGVLFLLPFGKSFFIPALFIWLCLVALSYFFYKDYSVDWYKSTLILPIVFYVLHSWGVFNSTNINDGYFDLQVKLSLLLIPLLYPYKRDSYKLKISYFFLAFIVGCVFAGTYDIANATYQAFSIDGGAITIDKWWFAFYLNWRFSVLMHPSYFGLYILFSLICINIWIVDWVRNRNTFNLFLLISGIFLLVILILLESRAGIFELYLMIVIMFGYFVLKRGKYIASIFIIGILLISSIYIISRFDRYSKTIKSLKTSVIVGVDNRNKEESTIVRYWIWRSAYDLVKHNPILGVGSGDIRMEMQKQFVKNKMPIAVEKRYNAHNQYLETWLGVGILGLISLLAMLFMPLWVGIKKRNWLLVGFICLCSVSFMFESMLNSIAGVGFFAIFYTILVSRNGAEPNVSMKPL